MKKFLGLLVMLIMISTNCLAMTFSQPVKVGSIGYVNLGGFVFRQVSKNDGVLSERQRSKSSKIYDHGIARFGDGVDALYLHYDAYKATVKDKKVTVISHGFTKFGDKNINNTLSFGILQPEIFQIKSDSGITFYSVNDSYDLTEEFTYTLLGRRKDGKWVKYFDTNELVKKYFGANQGYWLKELRVSGDTIIIYYELFSRGDYRNPTSRGEFRFKWDDKAQWFGIEQVIY